MPSSAEEFQVQSRRNDYRLGELLSEGTRTRTYRAEQISMDRPVILERIKPEDTADAEVVEQFLADVRAKAAVDHPGIGSVYEGVQDGDAVFYTREYLHGINLEDLNDGMTFLEAGTIASLLRQIGSAMDYLEERGIETLPLEPRHLVRGEHDVLRIVNLAIAEPVPSANVGHDRHLVAELLLDLLRRGTPGATRTRTLLSMMADEEGAALTWKQVAHTARKLEQDLSEGGQAAAEVIGSTPPEGRSRASGRKAAMILVGALVVAGLAAGALMFAKRQALPEVRDLSAMIEIPGGTYQTHEGKPIELERFWIDAHEVTIAEYADFLEALAHLPEGKRTGYDHRDQPVRKRDHLPENWEQVLRAARTGGWFEDRQVDPNHPVTGVDWWDAQAYANWRSGRLPRQEEWLAATGGSDPKPADLVPVDGSTEDLTPRGIYGLAGNVSEWVSEPAIDPAFPMNPERPLACGGSYLQSRGGARARIWLADRDQRRPDLGFRVVRSTAP